MFWVPVSAQKKAVWGHRTEAELEPKPPASWTFPRCPTSFQEESPNQERVWTGKPTAPTWQPELLKEGDEALKNAVDPVHCSGVRGDAGHDGVAPGSGPLPADPEPRHTPHKQSPNMQFQANVNNSALVIT